MSAAGLESIDHTTQLTHAWINELDEFLTGKIGTGEIDKVRHALPAYLRTLWPVSSEAA